MNLCTIYNNNLWCVCGGSFSGEPTWSSLLHLTKEHKNEPWLIYVIIPVSTEKSKTWNLFLIRISDNNVQSNIHRLYVPVGRYVKLRHTVYFISEINNFVLFLFTFFFLFINIPHLNEEDSRTETFWKMLSKIKSVFVTARIFEADIPNLKTCF